MSEGELTTLERGVYLHDIGKIGIPDRILLNPRSLTPEERNIMKTHCELGFRLASRVEFLREASTIILAHHERYDGTGYPRGLQGDAIPFGARLFGVIDTLDAMTSDRPYRPARSFEEAREEICRWSGVQFDPMIVEAFASLPLETWQAVRASVTSRV
jgi:HD-GYP domain-containing protein (c-di-GMP phosphodiesterase class II)